MQCGWKLCCWHDYQVAAKNCGGHGDSDAKEPVPRQGLPGHAILLPSSLLHCVHCFRFTQRTERDNGCPFRVAPREPIAPNYHSPTKDCRWRKGGQKVQEASGRHSRYSMRSRRSFPLVQTVTPVFQHSKRRDRREEDPDCHSILQLDTQRRANIHSVLACSDQCKEGMFCIH